MAQKTHFKLLAVTSLEVFGLVIFSCFTLNYLTTQLHDLGIWKNVIIAGLLLASYIIPWPLFMRKLKKAGVI
ncbi:MAG: hypothetical protein ACOCXT_04205 [Candidatus Dojkabacteria bacterium]